MTLDARQRAMLAEMGVRVWAPDVAAPPPPAPAPAPSPAAVREAPAVAAPVPTPVPAPARAAAPRAERAPATGEASWVLDTPRPLYPAAPAAPADAPAPVWLIALDSPTPDDPGGGEAGDLLHNMLRAMGLKDTPRVWVSTVRRAAAGTGDAASWAQAAGALRPALVLALGQSAARCVLGGGDPLALLRTREHRLVGGTPVVVSYAPAYLLRAPKAKREAWSDLQRAMALVQDAGPMP